MKRGKSMNFIRLTTGFLKLVSTASILYFFLILRASGIRTSFLWFFAALPAVCLTFSAVLKKLTTGAEAPLTAAKVLSILVWLALIIFLSVEIKVITYSSQKPAPGADYIIILGARVYGDTPSKTLNARINVAYEYLRNNPDTIAICSGGQGDDENISEAYAISRELTAMGISPDRIILEDKSTSTWENLIFSSEYISGFNSGASSVIIVTSDFHTFRTSLLAKRCGYSDIDTLSADEFLWTTPAYYVREFFALVAELLVNRIE